MASLQPQSGTWQSGPLALEPQALPRAFQPYLSGPAMARKVIPCYTGAKQGVASRSPARQYQASFAGPGTCWCNPSYSLTICRLSAHILEQWRPPRRDSPRG
jgi:hypothetical protein